METFVNHDLIQLCVATEPPVGGMDYAVHRHSLKYPMVVGMARDASSIVIVPVTIVALECVLEMDRRAPMSRL